MILHLALAAVMGVSQLGAPVEPDASAQPGPIDVFVEAQAHPEVISIDALTPDYRAVHIGSCLDTNFCVASAFVTHGLWTFVATVEYAHLDINGIPYVTSDAIAVNVVDPIVVFIDGFDNGTTDAWSVTSGGAP